jgi:alkylhydroperoxidase family enzyme
MVYKNLATLYFVFVFDSSENELAMLDLVQGNLTAYCVSFHLHELIGKVIWP